MSIKMGRPTKLRIIGNRYLKKYLKDKKYNVVLNIGCGNNSDKEGGSYCKYFNCKEIINIDPNPAFEKCVDYQSKCEDLPFKNNYSDMAFLNWVFVPSDPIIDINIEKSCKEIHRVLVPGGDIIASYADHTIHFKKNLKKIKSCISEYFEPIEIREIYVKNQRFLDDIVDWNAEIFFGKKK